MIVDVRDLPPEGAAYEGEDSAGMFQLPADGTGVEFESPVRYAIHVQLCGHELLARGRLRVTVGFRCSRCGERFDTEIDEPEFFANRDMNEEKSDPFVDLTADIRESILLAFPSHPVCEPGCRGLCPQCGVNWNKESCGCHAPTDDRWGALDQLST